MVILNDFCRHGPFCDIYYYLFPGAGSCFLFYSDLHTPVLGAEEAPQGFLLMMPDSLTTWRKSLNIKEGSNQQEL